MVPQRGFEYRFQPIVEISFSYMRWEVYPQKAPRLQQCELNGRWRGQTPCSTLRYMSTLILRAPDELDQALERQSAALGISKSDLALEALVRYLRKAEFRTLQTKLVARAQAGGINTDEEVFKAVKT
jgi:predicted transcriptional regulator